ncbi:Transport and Golgi organisation 2 [Chitinophaga sp. YR573]|uniref:NRDE family protein n=1 Tax=Chitinophaga sp. YR573 TaxID=1881040 RepID=UPI0008C8D602|nr:NRDE family protein [Chitinophaga sp. YR573]SEW36099.1 Transport and Golgi organisation 2 [Chitinophaga sp. YR573]
MCTVTFIPTTNGVHLTSNRDEHIGRSKAIIPKEYNGLLYPKDTDKNGSWLAAKRNGDVVILLNGAFVKYQVKPAYRKSRGLILLDIIKDAHPEQCFMETDLDDIAPFTLILYVSGRLYECRWDGDKKHQRLLDNKTAHIWSSATLYDKTITAEKEDCFNQWGASATTTEEILHFHHDMKLNGEKIKTVSITNIHITADNVTMTYNDLKHQYTRTLSPRAYRLKRCFIRLFNWEYWPSKVIYAPIMLYWFWLSMKCRSFFFFNTANPLIENGGFALESKTLIYGLIPQQYYPKTIAFKAGSTVHPNYPVIAKPDIGCKGVQVKLINNETELSDYIRQIPVDFLLQEYIPFKNEVGIFYYRFPGAGSGHISGIVGKEFLSVTGDGVSTMEELIIRNPRYLLQLPALRRTYNNLSRRVLAKGESLTLIPYGNHARGAKFIDLSHLINDQLTAVIDTVCQQIPEFYFGRLDIMYNSWEELCRGENFSIVELNGAGSEPTHIYDHSIFYAWKEIIRHWKILYRISKINKDKKALTYMTYKDGMNMLRKNAEYFKLIG